MPVHLTGRMCNMQAITEISKKYNIPVIEDCAQSIFSKYKNKYSATWGDAGCFSAHPLKNLNAIGDSGYVITNNKNLYNRMKNLRSHGMETNRNDIDEFGHVSRMDNLQAAVLNFRLKNLKSIVNKRRKNVNLYLKYLDKKHIFFSK